MLPLDLFTMFFIGKNTERTREVYCCGAKHGKGFPIRGFHRKWVAMQNKAEILLVHRVSEKAPLQQVDRRTESTMNWKASLRRNHRTMLIGSAYEASNESANVTVWNLICLHNVRLQSVKGNTDKTISGWNAPESTADAVLDSSAWVEMGVLSMVSLIRWGFAR